MEDFGGFTDDYYPTTNELFNTRVRSTGRFQQPCSGQDIINSSSRQQHGGAKRAHLVTYLQPGLFQPNEDRLRPSATSSRTGGQLL